MPWASERKGKKAQAKGDKYTQKPAKKQEKPNDSSKSKQNSKFSGYLTTYDRFNDRIVRKEAIKSPMAAMFQKRKTDKKITMMKNTKRVLTAAIAIVLLISSTSALAANQTEEAPSIQGMSMEAKENFSMAPDNLKENILSSDELREAAIYAYMSIETAPEALVPRILNAREKIIFSESWTVSGQTSTVRADGTVEYDPEFSHLFPNWDIPKDPDGVAVISSSIFDSFGANALSDSPKRITNYNIPKATDSLAPIMTYVTATTNEVIITKVTALTPSSCNVGYSHSGYSIGYKEYLGVDDYYRIFPQKGSTYGIRTSTYATSGLGSFAIAF